jgi:hypothetical protein
VALGDALLCLLAAILWSWPYAARLTTRLADAYDAQTQTWVIGWVRHALLTEPGRLWQANIFAPSRDALAFSEPLIGYAVVGLPFGLLGVNDVGVVNVVCLLFLAFTPWAIALLARQLGVPRAPALLGSLAASFGALAAATLGYVYFTASGGIAMLLVLWLRLRERATWGRAAGLGLAVAALGWFSLQLFAFGLVALGTFAVADLLVSRIARRGDVLGRAAASMALAALLLVPLAIPFLRVRRAEGFHRKEEETRRYSAAPADWLKTSHRNPGQSFLRRKENSERALYPGTMALALGVTGLVLTLRKKVAPAAAGVGLLLVLVGFIGSLGYDTPFYPLLVRAGPPVFGGIRVAARFARVATIGFGLLAAVGAAGLLARCRSARTRAAAVAALLAATAFDVRQSGAAPAFHPEIPAPPVELFFKDANTGGPILHLPLYHQPGDSRFMFASLAHFEPIVNGITSYVPAPHAALAERLQQRPIPADTRSVLESWPVGVIVAHEHALPLGITASTMDFLEDGLGSGALSGPLWFPHKGGDDWVFGVRKVRGDKPWPAGGGDPAANATTLREHVRAAPRYSSFEEGEFPAAIDEPAEFFVNRGPLHVRGWSQDGSGPGEIVEIRLGRDRRAPSSFVRAPRPDVARAVPALGSCEHAGYDAVLPFLPGDDGEHELVVVFRSSQGLLRTLRRPFTWLGE